MKKILALVLICLTTTSYCSGSKEETIIKPPAKQQPKKHPKEQSLTKGTVSTNGQNNSLDNQLAPNKTTLEDIFLKSSSPKPDWIKTVLREDNDYVYLLGVSKKSSKEEDAKLSCLVSGWEKLTKYLKSYLVKKDIEIEYLADFDIDVQNEMLDEIGRKMKANKVQLRPIKTYYEEYFSRENEINYFIYYQLFIVEKSSLDYKLNIIIKDVIEKQTAH